MSKLAGLWESSTHYRVIDPASGRSEIVSIMGTADEMRDPVFVQELEHKARETVERAWKKERAKRMTEQQRKDLGQILPEVHASHTHYAESLHGRYW